MHKERLLDKLDRKFGRFAIRNLMMIVVGAMAIIYIMDYLILNTKGVSILSMLTFNYEAILEGQVWRILTFIFLPPRSNIFFIIFSLYFYWLIGEGLESEWGAFKFNVFYFFGLFCTLIVGFFTGYATNTFINLSLFLAFAILFPDFEIRVFFLIPIKVVYIAIIDLISLITMLIILPWESKILIIISFANVILFFWRDFIDGTKERYRRYKYRKQADDYWKKR